MIPMVDSYDPDCCISVYSTTERRGLSNLHGRDEDLFQQLAQQEGHWCAICSCRTRRIQRRQSRLFSFTHILTYVQVYDLIFSDLGPPVVARIRYNFKVMRVTYLF